MEEQQKEGGVNAWTLGKPIEDEKEDVEGIVHLEHININVPSQGPASIFYFEGLGFARDPFFNVGAGTMWANVGRQQIHLPLNAKPQLLQGHIGIVMTSLEALVKRLEAVKAKLKDTAFNFEWTKGDSVLPYLEGASAENYLQVTCPWGNRYKIFESQLETRGTPYIAYIEELCTKGSAPSIAEYYHSVFGAIVYCDNPEAELKTVRVRTGLRQYLVFREVEEKVEYSGYHVCMYITKFSAAYKQVKARDLLLKSNRFSDIYSTIEEALSSHQFRTADIVDLKTNKVVHCLEHEVRSLYHPSFMRVLVNRFGDIGFYCQQ